MKIAFSGKESQSNSFGLSSLLHSNKREQEAKALAKQQEEASLEEENAQKRIDPGEEVEWKKLFLNNQGDEREFRKLRICIVQREETLETIAGRYQLNPREILLYNRLADQHINEGQVLYIPQVQ
nr:LysM peptidoglycan-binding domain-containing protein [Paenibacillus roseus]